MVKMLNSTAMKLLLLAIGLSPIAQARPQWLDVAATVTSGGADTVGYVSMAGDGALGIVSEAAHAVRDIGDEFRGFVQGAFKSGAQTAGRFTSAVSDTAKGVVGGVSDVMGATKTYFADNVRTGGRLTKGALEAGVGVAKGAAGATGNFLHEVRGAVKGGLDDATDAFDDFAGDVIDTHINFLSAATGVVGDVATQGVENFAHILVPVSF